MLGKSARLRCLFCYMAVKAEEKQKGNEIALLMKRYLIGLKYCLRVSECAT